MIRVLIADDSALQRKLLREILSLDPEIDVVDVARNGEEAVDKARRLKPDVVTMDINMPVMDGVTAMQHIVNEALCPVLMVSSLTQEGAAITLEALELGAFDYVPKPGGTVSHNLKAVGGEILEKVRAAAGARTRRPTRPAPRPSAAPRPERPAAALRPLRRTLEPRRMLEPRRTLAPRRAALCIGASTGGPGAVAELLSALPDDLGVPVFVVQHMPSSFTAPFARRLNDVTPLEVMEAEAGEEVRPNVVYVGRGGSHINLTRASDGRVMFRLTRIPTHRFMPSVDVMMDSALHIYGPHLVAVLLTGMGDDGARAMASIRKAGGVTIAESAETAVVFGMPAAAIALGGAQYVLPRDGIPAQVVRSIRHG